MTMQISLPPQQEEQINKRVEAGQYASASDVIQSALKLLDREEQLHDITLDELKKEVQLGLDQAKRGETSPFDSAAVEDIKKRGRQRMAARNRS